MTEVEVRRWDPDGESFLNVNTPEEWQAAQAKVQSQPALNAKERPEGLSS